MASLAICKYSRSVASREGPFHGSSLEHGIWYVPKPSLLPMTIDSMLPPATEIGKRVLASCRTHGGKATRGRPGKFLPEAWERHHYLITEKSCGDLPKLRPGQRSLSTRSLCARLGRCVCKQTEALAARSELGRVIKLLVKKKKTVGRAVYDRNGVVLHLCSTSGSRGRGVDEFVFFGFGNLLDMMYAVQPLELSTAQVDPAF